jgi:hypothetical protein
MSLGPAAVFSIKLHQHPENIFLNNCKNARFLSFVISQNFLFSFTVKMQKMLSFVCRNSATHILCWTTNTFLIAIQGKTSFWKTFITGTVNIFKGGTALWPNCTAVLFSECL